MDPNKKISSIDTSNSVHTHSSVSDSNGTGQTGNEISADAADITDSLGSILKALGVSKSQLKSSFSDHTVTDRGRSSKLDLKGKNSVTGAVEAVQSNIQSHGAVSILTQANLTLQYALSIMEV
jgi:hypothetical protein